MDLKPCPFCGRKVKLINTSILSELYDDIWVVEHEEIEPVCFLWHNKGYEGKKEDIIELWNRRTNIQNMEETIKKDRDLYRSLLLPCKKCKQSTYRIVNYYPSGYRITCTNCSYSTKVKEILDDACSAWNQRNV